MSKAVKPIPEGYHTLSSYIIVRQAQEAIEFYKKAFGAVERFRLPGPDGKTIGHAELQFGDSILMLADEAVSPMNKSPQTLGGSTFCFVMYVEDVDAAFQRAVAAGATVLRPLENKFYGDRMGMVADPYGHAWGLMQHVEDVPPAEVARRAAAEQAKMPAK